MRAASARVRPYPGRRHCRFHVTAQDANAVAAVVRRQSGAPAGGGCAVRVACGSEAGLFGWREEEVGGIVLDPPPHQLARPQGFKGPSNRDNRYECLEKKVLLPAHQATLTA